MISLNWDKMSREIADLAKSYQQLPPHIGKKHLLASMRRSIKEVGGVQKLRAATPPAGTRRGRRKKGEKRISTGALRRSVAIKARWIGRNRDGVAMAGLGYKYGWESRKAIWHEFGTTRMAAKHMMQRTFESIRGPVASKLAGQMAAALEKAAAEVAGGKNHGYQG